MSKPDIFTQPTAEHPCVWPSDNPTAEYPVVDVELDELEEVCEYCGEDSRTGNHPAAICVKG